MGVAAHNTIAPVFVVDDGDFRGMSPLPGQMPCRRGFRRLFPGQYPIKRNRSGSV